MENRTPLFRRIDEFYENSFLLENVSFYCGECGSKMQLSTHSKGSVRKYYTYYSCRFHAMTPKEIMSLHLERGRCDMRVDATTLDNHVLAQVMQFLLSIVTCARNGLTNLNLQKITERMKHHLIPMPEWISLRSSQEDACGPATGWEIDEIPGAELERIKNLCSRNAKRRRYRNMKRDAEQCNYRLIDGFDGHTLKIASRRLMVQSELGVPSEISSHIEAMPFSLRKRIIESVIASDKGGQCVIKWAGQTDGSCNSASAGAGGRFSRSRFRVEPMEVEITFYASPDRLQNLIWGRQGAELFDPESR